MEERVGGWRLWLLSVSVGLLLLSPYLLSYGMFFDGVIYSAVSRNLAIGFGEFWRPAYSLTLGREFYGHPPLGFWMQSLPYRLLGDHLWIDKAYSFGVGILNIALLYLLWRVLQIGRYSGFWAPLLLLLTLPSVRWVMRNDLLENPMTLFILAASILYALSLRRRLFLSLPAGLSVGLAFLVKGPVSLFALLFPITFANRFGWRRSLLSFLLGLSAFVALAVLILSTPEARHFFQEYVRRQIAVSVAGLENPAPSRLYIIYALMTELVFPVSILAVAKVVLGGRLTFNGDVLSLLLLGLSGSLPIMVSLKQSRFYLFPSLFFYVLALSILFSQVIANAEKNVALRRVAGLLTPTFVVAALAVAIRFAGSGMGGYEPFYRDFVERPLRLNLRSHELLSVCPKSLYGNWSLFAGMERVFKLSMSLGEGHRFLLVEVGKCEAPEGYRPIHPEGEATFRLYRRISDGEDH
ncbi:MAG: hypothetical protein GXO29_06835 [Thermotogae bacterium]|nr:hypothetical protein [Thermotogota bacterium]